jgi:transcriptional regulator with XRE-family HTH domain
MYLKWKEGKKMNELAKKIRERRLEEALSQSDLAQKIGVTSVTVSRVERGISVGSNTIRKLSFFLDLDTRIVRNLMLKENYEDNE